MLLLGAHLSVAGGVDRAIGLANQLGCNCLQIFVKNQRQWSAKPLDEEVVERWHAAKSASDPAIECVVAHSAYLINLAGDAAIRQKSVAALAEELTRCGQLGIDRLVLHPGSHRGQGADVGIDLIAAGLTEAMKRAEGAENVRILLEVTAGAGDTLGETLEEIAQMIDRCKGRKRLGLCLDTCHLFAAGVNLADRQLYDNLITRADELIGLDWLGCVHLNDSLGACGSHRDRHQAIGEGEIGLACFEYFMSDKRLATVPKIIETPKSEDDELAEDRRNLATLRKLAAEK